MGFPYYYEKIIIIFDSYSTNVVGDYCPIAHLLHNEPRWTPEGLAQLIFFLNQFSYCNQVVLETTRPLYHFFKNRIFEFLDTHIQESLSFSEIEQENLVSFGPEIINTFFD